ncbi:MAG TPA: hypothetical protein ENG03_11015 [Thioploca sp.]|nr:hypothetical protein [Thioploca sp.]
MNTKTCTKTVGGIAITVSLLLASNNVLAGRFTDQVREQLVAIGVLLGLGDNYELSSSYVNSLRDDRSNMLTMSLSRGRSYAIVAVCDQDCRDIDLLVYNENDQLVGKDIKADDKPMVGISPRWSGDFRVQVKMISCSASPCYYGVGLFGKTR